MLSSQIFKKDDEYFEDLGANVWLMDNHKWALYVWEINRQKSGFYTLVHVDYHWDSIYDFWEITEKEKELKEASIDDVKLLITNEDLIQYDSFIGPAIARGLIDDIHFLCYQDGDDEGFTEDVLLAFNAKQTIHNNAESLKNIEIKQPLLFDFCLDVFNRSDYDYQSDLWDDDEIEALLLDCKSLVEHADVVTVSMSYSYSGTEEDTKKLTERVVPMFLEWRNHS